MLAECHQHAPLVGARADAAEVVRERRGAPRPGQRVDQIGLGLALDVHPDRSALARCVEIEHGAERVGRFAVAVLAVVRPPHLVERDRAQRGIRAGAGVLVEADAGREALLIELHVPHAQPRLLAVGRLRVLADQDLEVGRGSRISFVGQDHAGVEQHRVAMRKVAILVEDLPVERERAGVAEHRDREPAGGSGGLPARVVRHALGERLAVVGELEVREPETHLGAGRRTRVAGQKRRQQRNGGGAPARRLGVGRRVGRAVRRRRRAGARRDHAIGRRVARAEAHAHAVGRRRETVVDRLALAIQGGEGAAHRRARHVVAQRRVRHPRRIEAGREPCHARLEPLQGGGPACRREARVDRAVDRSRPRQGGARRRRLAGRPIDHRRAPGLGVGAREQRGRAGRQALGEGRDRARQAALGGQQRVGPGQAGGVGDHARGVGAREREPRHGPHPQQVPGALIEDRGGARRDVGALGVAHPAQPRIEGGERGAQRVEEGGAGQQLRLLPAHPLAPDREVAALVGERFAGVGFVPARALQLRLGLGDAPGGGHDGAPGLRGRRRHRRRGRLRGRSLVERRRLERGTRPEVGRRAGELPRARARRARVEQHQAGAGGLGAPGGPQGVERAG